MNTQRLLMGLLSVFPLLLAGLIWNLSVEPSIEPPALGESAADLLPDSIATEATFSQFDASGRLYQRIGAKRAVSYNGGETVDLNEPKMLVIGTEASWSGSSHEGSIDWPGGEVILESEVILQRLGDHPSTLQTSKLSWNPTTASAFSDQHVVIIAPGHSLESLGINIDLDRSIFTLFNQVKGQHGER